jgi:hypothetical protein
LARNGLNVQNDTERDDGSREQSVGTKYVVGKKPERHRARRERGAIVFLGDGGSQERRGDDQTRKWLAFYRLNGNFRSLNLTKAV